MAAIARQALINRQLDFWLLGGFSLCTLALLMAWRQWDPHALQSSFWLSAGLYLRIAIEYPHLLATYKLAYSRGRGFIFQHWFALIIGPLLLLTAAAWIVLSLDFQLLGEASARYASDLLHLGVHGIFLGFGWHRARQVWGCMILYARYDRMDFGARKRSATNLFLLMLWVFGYLSYMTQFSRLDFFAFHVEGLSLPWGVMPAVGAAFVISGLWFLWEVVLRPFLNHETLPSLNFTVPLIALLFWWTAMSVEPNFFFFLAPSFHSLQYFAVVWAYERGPKTRDFQLGQAWPYVFLMLGFILISALWEFMPHRYWPEHTSLIAIAYIAVSFHHYLLDGVIWRTTDPQLKNLLE